MANITIADDRKICDIQREFSSFFPFLKIDFFSLLHSANGTFDRKRMINPEKKIGEVRSIRSSRQIIIDDTMSVTELEKKFREVFGLTVHVFRKSGNAWLQSTVTDAWTLGEQNKQGEYLSASCNWDD